MGQLNRITQQPDVMDGKVMHPWYVCTVGRVVGQIGAGHSIDEIRADYAYLEREDIMHALCYAAWRAKNARLCHPEPPGRRQGAGAAMRRGDCGRLADPFQLQPVEGHG